jgi:alpha-glucosidase
MIASIGSTKSRSATLGGIAREKSGSVRVPELPWWKTGGIYQIAVASFADSDGDGIGDLRGIIERLDYLNDGTAASLGVDAIWLTPINSSPMRDFGYDVTDYRSINPRFGSMRDFEELLDECHARGVRVMMDLVLNHTSHQHPWFLESRSSRDNPRRDWYVWRDGRGPRKPPNRWRSVVEGSAWQYDDATGQYFYHAFLPGQPDLNWRNLAVHDEMLEVVKFWLDKGVDGFRLDLINFLFEDDLLRDNPRRLGLRPYDWQVHRHDRSQPESVEVARELRRLTDRYTDRAMMGEVYTDSPEEAIAFLGDGSDALHLAFYLDFAERRWDSEQFRESVDWLEAQLPPPAWPCYYLNNHDLPRTYTRLGRGRDAEAKAKVAAAMLFTLRGTPIIYYGEEIGMPASKVPRHMMDDPLGKKFWPMPIGRDGSRTPMQWTSGRHAGFTTGEPWLPCDPSSAIRNVECQDGEPASLLNWYRQLIHLRAERPALRAGSYRAAEDAPRGIYAYLREADGDCVAVLLNFTSRSVTFRRPLELLEVRAWKTLLSTDGGAGEPRELSGLELGPYEALVLGAMR